MKYHALFLILRRMRMPLLALIATYAISVLGLTLMPGADAQGNPQRMSFFHAFYVITYTATTTGFGELPHAFTNAQRLWVTLSMYLSIVAWLYAIGALIALMRDPAFQRVFTETRFAAAVRRLSDPFYIVCGYGDTGAAVVQALTSRVFSAVVLDIRQERINELILEDPPFPVPALAADASLPAYLLLAGLKHPRCAGVLALCESDAVNLKIAISAKLLNPTLKVITRAQSHDTQANMESFNTDHTINPFDSFADRLAMALHSPDIHLLYQWLTTPAGTPLPARIDPPHGTWVLCGYGRFGKSVSRYLQYEGISTVIIEAEPELTEAPKGTVHGRGTEAVTLREARIEQAVGIVAGTDHDANNLSIIITARMLNPKLFTVARQNLHENDPIFEAAGLDLVMQRSRALARRILSLVSTPLLINFLRLARHKSNDWARELIDRLRPVAGGVVPDVWTIDVTAEAAPALVAMLEAQDRVRLKHLLTDPHERDIRLPAIALLLRRDDEEQLLPDEETELKVGDRLLFCGRQGVVITLKWSLHNRNMLRYIYSGEIRPDGTLWRWWRGVS